MAIKCIVSKNKGKNRPTDLLVNEPKDWEALDSEG